MTIYTYNLTAFQIDPDVPIYRYPHPETKPMGEDDPAISVMTDLKYIRMITVNPDDTIDTASQIMVHAGVRLLVVLDDNNSLLGLITRRDIMGEKPLSMITKGKTQREEILVKDIMTSRAELNPLNMHDVEHVSVKDIINTLHEARRQHVIVVEDADDSGTYYLRGIFSITQIGRQVGVEISADDQVQSFAEFEQLIAEDISTVTQ
jgi:CBS-domain-containing membrane protein